MFQREKQKADSRLQSLAKAEQMQLEQSLQDILRMEQRTAEQLALLVQHKDLAAQVRASMVSSFVPGAFLPSSWRQLSMHVVITALLSQCIFDTS